MVSAVLEVAEPRRVPSGDFEVSSGDREAPLADGLAAHASARRWHAPEAHRRVVTCGAIWGSGWGPHTVSRSGPSGIAAEPLAGSVATRPQRWRGFGRARGTSTPTMKANASFVW